MNDIPSDLAEAVRHAAAAVPDERHSLAGVHRRRRRHQRRRTATVAGLAAMAVAAGVPVFMNRTGPAPEPFATASASATAGPAQRLMVTGGAALAIEGPGVGVGVNSPAGILEVDAAGKLIAHPVTGMDAVSGVVALPDGRLVTLGTRDLNPGTRREDGPDVTDLNFVLTLGTTYSADVRIPGEQLQLLGATAEGAYLLRNRRRLVFHEFATGTERPLDAATAALAAPGDPVHMFESFVQGRFLVFHRVDRGQQIHIVDVTTGAYVVPPVTLPGKDLVVDGVRLSPDGRTVAVAVGRFTADRAAYELLGIEVATGRVGRTQEIAVLDGKSKASGLLGMAFAGNNRLRVAWYAFPPDANRVYELAELMKVSPFTV